MTTPKDAKDDAPADHAIVAIYKKVFDTLDEDESGTVSAEELEGLFDGQLAAALPLPPFQLTEVDTSGDGVISWLELKKWVLQKVIQAGASGGGAAAGDGKGAPSRFQTLCNQDTRAARRKANRLTAKEEAAAAGKENAAPAGSTNADVEHVVAIYKRVYDALDADGSGSVTAGELEGLFEGKQAGALPLPAFTVADVDADGDGELAWGELETWVRRAAAKHAAARAAKLEADAKAAAAQAEAEADAAAKAAAAKAAKKRKAAAAKKTAAKTAPKAKAKATAKAPKASQRRRRRPKAPVKEATAAKKKPKKATAAAAAAKTATAPRAPRASSGGRPADEADDLRASALARQRFLQNTISD